MQCCHLSLVSSTRVYEDVVLAAWFVFAFFGVSIDGDSFIGVDWCRMSRATIIYYVSSLSLAYGRRYVLSSWFDSGVGRHVNVRTAGQSTKERTRGLQGQVSDDIRTEQQILGFLGEILSVLVPFFRCVVT